MSTLDLTADEHKLRMPTVSALPRTFRDRFVARIDYRYMGLAVVCTETSTDVWDITTFPGTTSLSTAGDGIGIGLDTNAADFIFYGGQTYFVENGLAQALLAAGYELLGEGFSSGFSTGFEV